MIKIADIKPVCYTNINNMCEEMYDFFDKVAQATIPKKTRHRQSLPPWITPSLSNLMKKLNTQRKLVANKPESCRKNILRKFQNVVRCERGRRNRKENNEHQRHQCDLQTSQKT